MLRLQPGGAHYKDDPGGASVPPNELWLSSTDDPTAGIKAKAGVAHGRGSADWVARPDAQSVVIHYIPPGGTTAGESRAPPQLNDQPRSQGHVGGDQAAM